MFLDLGEVICGGTYQQRTLAYPCTEIQGSVRTPTEIVDYQVFLKLDSTF